MKRLIKRGLGLVGIDLGKRRRAVVPPADASSQDGEILSRIARCTMTSVERQMTLIGAVRHIVKTGVEGCFVECGVWRGGSSMAMALALLQEQDTQRALHLFDTFEGMTQPLDIDRKRDGTLAKDHLKRDPGRVGEVWAVATLEDVQTNMRSTGYPEDRICFRKGPVEETIPRHSPEGQIALLRLDTDWYESTRHELIHLFPKLSKGGILIIDDYGHWAGARKAVDEYFAESQPPYFLHRIDSDGRLLVKY